MVDFVDDALVMQEITEAMRGFVMGLRACKSVIRKSVKQTRDRTSSSVTWVDFGTLSHVVTVRATGGFANLEVRAEGKRPTTTIVPDSDVLIGLIDALLSRM